MREPSAFVAGLLMRTARPHKIVDFPAYDDTGKAITQVFVRGLTVEEEAVAWANAARNVGRLLGDGKDLPWRPENVEHNARAQELLAVACRKVDDPSQPFFEHGIVDVRQFDVEQLGQLLATYEEVKELYYPTLASMTEDEFEAWVAMIARGAEAFPFSSVSPSKLATIVSSIAKSLLEARATITMLTESSTSDS